MPLIIADRVQETTATSGTGTLALLGPVAQFQSFAVGIGTGNTTFYTLVSGDQTSWECGLGTVGGSSGAYTLARTTIISSSNSNAAISLTGTSTVFCDLPASKVVSPSVNTFYSGSSTSLSSGTFTGSYIAVDSCTLTIPPSLLARVFSVSASVTTANGSHAMRGGILLDGTNVFPKAMTSNVGWQNVSGQVDGAVMLMCAGVVVTVPGDNASHTIAMAWQPSGSTAAVTLYDRSITAIQVG